MDEPVGKRIGGDLSEVIPDGPWQQIISLVPHPHRNNVRLVCRKFCSLESLTRTRLVFRVPRAQQPDTSSAPCSQSVYGQVGDNSDADSQSTGQPTSDSRRTRDAPKTGDDGCTNGGKHLLPGVPLNLQSMSPNETTTGAPLGLSAHGLDVEEKHPRVLLVGISSTAVNQGDIVPSIDHHEYRGSTQESPHNTPKVVSTASPTSSLLRAAKEDSGTKTLWRSDHMNALEVQQRQPAPCTLSGSTEKEDLACSELENAGALEGLRTQLGNPTAAELGYASDAESSFTCNVTRPFRRAQPTAFAASEGELSEDDTCLESKGGAGRGDTKKRPFEPHTPSSGQCTEPCSPGVDHVSARKVRNSFAVDASAGVHQGAATCASSLASLSKEASSSHVPRLSPVVSGTPSPSIQAPGSFFAAVVPAPSSLFSLMSDCNRQEEPQDQEYSAEERLSILLRKFPNLQSIDICNLQAGQGLTGALDARLLSVVAKYAHGLEELHLSGQSLGMKVDDAGLAAVARGCPKLRRLVVHHWVMGPGGMAAFAEFGHLKELEMDFFARDHITGPQKTIAEVARCSTLTSLHLRYCNNDDVRVIAEGCPSLTRLTLLFSVLGSSFSTLGIKCRKLQELTLRSCDADAFEDPLLCLAQHCNSLTSLSLHAGHVASEEGLLRLISSCPGLIKLSLEFKPLPLSLENVAHCLSGIRELTLQWISASDDDLVALSQHCKNLSVLVLSLLQNVSDRGVAALLEGCGPSLGVLSLRVRDASDHLLEVLGRKCCKLQRLTLGLPHITSAGFERMFLQGPGNMPALRGMRRLKLWDCSSLDDSVLDHISLHCPNLEGLGIKGCSNLNPEKFPELIRSCAKLDRLEVEHRFFAAPVIAQAKASGVEMLEPTH